MPEGSEGPEPPESKWRRVNVFECINDNECVPRTLRRPSHWIQSREEASRYYEDEATCLQQCHRVPFEQKIPSPVWRRHILPFVGAELPMVARLSHTTQQRVAATANARVRAALASTEAAPFLPALTPDQMVYADQILNNENVREATLAFRQLVGTHAANGDPRFLAPLYAYLHRTWYRSLGLESKTPEQLTALQRAQNVLGPPSPRFGRRQRVNQYPEPVLPPLFALRDVAVASGNIPALVYFQSLASDLSECQRSEEETKRIPYRLPMRQLTCSYAKLFEPLVFFNATQRATLRNMIVTALCARYLPADVLAPYFQVPEWASPEVQEEAKRRPHAEDGAGIFYLLTSGPFANQTDSGLLGNDMYHQVTEHAEEIVAQALERGCLTPDGLYYLARSILNESAQEPERSTHSLMLVPIVTHHRSDLARALADAYADLKLDFARAGDYENDASKPIEFVEALQEALRTDLPPEERQLRQKTLADFVRALRQRTTGQYANGQSDAQILMDTWFNIVEVNRDNTTQLQALLYAIVENPLVLPSDLAQNMLRALLQRVRQNQLPGLDRETAIDNFIGALESHPVMATPAMVQFLQTQLGPLSEEQTERLQDVLNGE